MKLSTERVDMCSWYQPVRHCRTQVGRRQNWDYGVRLHPPKCPAADGKHMSEETTEYGLI